MYNGNDLMLQAGGEAIVVVIQYRVGVFGFFGSQRVHDRGTSNAGLCEYNLKQAELVIEFRQRRRAVSLDQQARWRSQEGDESAGACYCDWISLSNFNHKVLHSMEIHNLRSSVQL